jgi:hypothetical protein
MAEYYENRIDSQSAIRITFALACLALAAGLIAAAAPAGAQAPSNPLPLLFAHNLCQDWIVEARAHPERTTMEMARQRCLELRARVNNAPTGREPPLPTVRLTAAEAQAWCVAARIRVWWFFGDDVLKPDVDDAHARARCDQAAAQVDPAIVAPNGWRMQFVPVFK